MDGWGLGIGEREKEVGRGGNEMDAFFVFLLFSYGGYFLQAYLSFKLFYYLQSLGFFCLLSLAM